MISIESNVNNEDMLDWRKRLDEKLENTLKELNIDINKISMSFYDTDIEKILIYQPMFLGTLYIYKNKKLIFGTDKELYDFETMENVTKQYEKFRDTIIMVNALAE